MTDLYTLSTVQCVLFRDLNFTVSLGSAWTPVNILFQCFIQHKIIEYSNEHRSSNYL